MDDPHFILKITFFISFQKLLLNYFSNTLFSQFLYRSCSSNAFTLVFGTFHLCYAWLKNLIVIEVINISSFIAGHVVSVSFNFFVVLHWSKVHIFLPLELSSIISSFIWLVYLFVYNMLLVRNIMQSGTSKLEMIELFAKFTWFYFKFIRNVSTFVAKETI